MEIEPSTQMIAKNIYSFLKMFFHMMRKNISKSKLMVDLHMLLKRGKLAGKAITDLMLHHHYAALTCRSDDVRMSFITPREYEFSCSNSPVYRKKHHHGRHRRHHQHGGQEIHVDVRKVIDLLNHYDASPLTVLPGFGHSPLVRQLRVTDSPFLMDAEKNSQVDMDAEEFINKFYRELKNQKRIAAAQSPSPYHTWA